LFFKTLPLFKMLARFFRPRGKERDIASLVALDDNVLRLIGAYLDLRQGGFALAVCCRCICHALLPSTSSKRSTSTSHVHPHLRSWQREEAKVARALTMDRYPGEWIMALGGELSCLRLPLYHIRIDDGIDLSSESKIVQRFLSHHMPLDRASVARFHILRLGPKNINDMPPREGWGIALQVCCKPAWRSLPQLFVYADSWRSCGSSGGSGGWWGCSVRWQSIPERLRLADYLQRLILNKTCGNWRPHMLIEDSTQQLMLDPRTSTLREWIVSLET